MSPARFDKIKLVKEAPQRVCDAWGCHTRLAGFAWKDNEPRDSKGALFLFCDHCKDKLLARAAQPSL